MSRISMIIVLVAAAFALSACGGGMSAPKMPVDEAKALNASVTGDYTNAQATWTAAQENAGQIGQLTGVDVATLEIEKFKTSLTECFNTPIETFDAVKEEANEAAADAGAGKDQSASKDVAEGVTESKAGYETIKSCPAATETNITAYTANVDEQTGSFYVAKVTQVDHLRKDLMHILPTNVENLTKNAPGVLEESAKIRANAEAALKAVESNPLAKPEDKKKAKADYETVIAELDAVETTAKSIQEDLVNMPAEISTLATKVLEDIQNLGQTTEEEPAS